MNPLVPKDDPPNDPPDELPKDDPPDNPADAPPKDEPTNACLGVDRKLPLPPAVLELDGGR